MHATWVLLGLVGLAAAACALATRRERRYDRRLALAIKQLLDAARSWLAPTCDMPGCDADAKPLMFEGSVSMLCDEHTVTVGRVLIGDGGQA